MIFFYRIVGSFLGSIFISTLYCNAQLAAVEVAELTLKIGATKTEELYYGFAEGDKIEFSFEEVKGKTFKEIEIVELPGSSKFMDYKCKSSSKTLVVNKKAVYKFSFRNSALIGRICKVHIKRIPKDESTKNFITDWKWETKYDTTYTPYVEDSLVGYDTLRFKEKIKELVKTEKHEEIVVDKNQRVHSQGNSNGNKTCIFFTLPEDQITTYKTKKNIAWAYWVGVDEAGNKAWKQNMQTVGSLAKGVASVYSTPLGALAVGAVADLIVPSVGEDVSYGLCDRTNKNYFLQGLQYRGFDFGKGVAGYRKFSDKNMLHGAFFITLSNDNLIQGINANVKVSVITETKFFEDKVYDRQKITPKYIQLNKKRMDVKSTKIRVCSG